MGDLMRRSVKVQSFTPVVTASSAYSALNVVGTLFEIAGGVLGGGGFSIVKSITGLSKSKADPALVLVLFKQEPAGTFTDKTAFDPSAADLLLISGICPFGSAWKDFTTASASKDADLDVVVQGIASDPSNSGKGGSLWGVLYTTGTPTFGSSSDLTVNIAFEQY